MNWLFSEKELNAAKSRDVLPIECPQCHKVRMVEKRFVQCMINGTKKMFCSIMCGSEYNHPPIIVPCHLCGKPTRKTPSQRKKFKHSFCSRSCAAKFNNREMPKRKRKQRKCKLCKILFATDARTRYSYCATCRTDYRLQGNAAKTEVIKNTTIKEYMSKMRPHLAYANRYVAIRGLAKNWNKDMKDKPCVVCGYSSIVELCHIRPISSFPDDATIGEINGPGNLIPLCPNHHWEFDRGLILQEERSGGPTRIPTEDVPL